jgi:hypothetical protein
MGLAMASADYGRLRISAPTWFGQQVLPPPLDDPSDQQHSLVLGMDDGCVGAYPRSKIPGRHLPRLFSARRSPHFEISKEAVEWLTERTELLLAAVEAVCRKYLDDIKLN